MCNFRAGSVSSFIRWALLSGWQGKKASAFPKESNYYYKAFPFSHLTELLTGKLLGTECSPFMALDVGKEDINTMHGKIIGWEKLLVHSIYHGVHYTFTGHTGEG